MLNADNFVFICTASLLAIGFIFFATVLLAYLMDRKFGVKYCDSCMRDIQETIQNFRKGKGDAEI